MEKLLEQATKWLNENPSINEVELTDGFGNKVRVVRNQAFVYSYGYPTTWNPSYPINPNTGLPY